MTGNTLGTSVPDDTARVKPREETRKRRLPLSRTRVVWGAVVLVVAVLIALSLRPTPQNVEAGLVVRGSLETSVDAEGMTRVRERYTVAAPVSGRLERIALREGDPVEAGVVVARIWPVPLDPQSTAQATAQVTGAEARLQEAQARARQSAAAVEQQRRSTARTREVGRVGGLSAETVERAELELATAERELEAAQARVRSAASELATARASLMALEPQRNAGSASAVVRSPGPGRVLRVHVSSERVVQAGTPLVEVGDASGLEVVVDVLSTDAVRIRAGAAMRLIEWGGNGELQAHVRYVEPSAFTKVSALGVEEQRVNVVGDVVDPPTELGDGYRVDVRIVTWQSADVVKVPVTALFRTGSEWGVFVLEDGIARNRAVRIGHRGTAEAEVLEGLQPQEQVVMFPSDKVYDGARVRPLGENVTPP